MMGVSSAYRNTLSVYKRGKVVIQMKKVYAVNICVLIVMFLTAGAAAKPADDDKMMKQLIAQRIEILEQYYRSEAEFDQSRSDLEKVEAGGLLKTDVKYMKEYAATELDRILDFRIKIKSCRRTRYGIVKGKAEIVYVTKGYGPKRTEKHQYFFTGEDCKKKLKLTQLKKI